MTNAAAVARKAHAIHRTAIRITTDGGTRSPWSRSARGTRGTSSHGSGLCIDCETPVDADAPTGPYGTILRRVRRVDREMGNNGDTTDNPAAGANPSR